MYLIILDCKTTSVLQPDLEATTVPDRGVYLAVANHRPSERGLKLIHPCQVPRREGGGDSLESQKHARRVGICLTGICESFFPFISRRMRRCSTKLKTNFTFLLKKTTSYSVRLSTLGLLTSGLSLRSSQRSSTALKRLIGRFSPTPLFLLGVAEVSLGVLLH